MPLKLTLDNLSSAGLYHSRVSTVAIAMPSIALTVFSPMVGLASTVTGSALLVAEDGATGFCSACIVTLGCLKSRVALKVGLATELDLKEDYVGGKRPIQISGGSDKRTDQVEPRGYCRTTLPIFDET